MISKNIPKIKKGVLLMIKKYIKDTITAIILSVFALMVVQFVIENRGAVLFAVLISMAVNCMSILSGIANGDFEK
jgi:hypothetical protein